MGTPLSCAADGDETVTVKDFALVPLSNLGFPSSNVELHPKGLVGCGYDSNLYLNSADDGKTGGWYLHGIAGLDLRWLPNDTDRVTFANEVERSVYRGNPQRDFTGFSSTLHGNRDDTIYAFLGDAGYQRTQDPLVESRVIVPRDLWRVLGQGSYKGLLDTWTVGLSQEGTRFRDGFSGYTADEASFQTFGTFLRYGYQVAEEDELYARLDGDRVLYRDSSAFNNSSGLRGVVGARRGVGAHTDALLEAGLSWRRYGDTFHEPDPLNHTLILYGDTRQALGPSGKAELHYSWEELSAVSLKSFSEVTDSLTANAAWYYGVSTELRQRLLQNCAALAGLQAYRFRDLHPPGGLDAETRTTVGTTVGIEYFLQNGVGLRLLGTYEDSHARLSESYNRFTVFTDLAVVF